MLIFPNVLTPKSQSRIKAAKSIASNDLNPYGVPENFAEFAALCQVRSGTDFVPFRLYDYQIELGRLIDECTGVAVLKTRQLGWSECVSCKMLHDSLLNPAYLGVSFSLGQSESSKLSDRVGLMPAKIPDFGWAIDSKTARKSGKGGELLFRPSTANAGRSLASVTCINLDECGFPADIAEMYANAVPAMQMAGSKAKRILGTTIPPEGLGCWYGETFWSDLPFDLEEEVKRVQEGRGRQGKGFSYWIDDDNWARVLLHWHSNPVYSSVPDRLARIKRDEQITEDQLQREHNLGLPKQGGSLFSIDLIAQYALAQWQSPNLSHRYLIGIDPNFGSSGGDSFVVQVWDTTSYPIALVAQHSDNQHSTSYNRAKAAELIEQYNPAIVAIESNAGGTPIAEELARVCPRTRFELINTSEVRKRLMTDRIALALEQGDVIFPIDWEGIDQIKRFSAANRKATTGHDDQVMAWAIAFAFVDEIVTIQPADYESAGEAIGVEDLIESIF